MKRKPSGRSRFENVGMDTFHSQKPPSLRAWLVAGVLFVLFCAFCILVFPQGVGQ